MTRAIALQLVAGSVPDQARIVVHIIAEHEYAPMPFVPIEIASEEDVSASGGRNN
jgi:hypothetical protein